jgi:SAM-dependent methyltransferase
MIVRLDFGGEARRNRCLRVAEAPTPGAHVVARLGPALPFRKSSVDEVFLDHALAHTDAGLAPIMEELWRICKPGTLVHLRLPHASSSWALSRDPRHSRHFTLETFNYFDPKFKNATCASPASFHVEHARLYLTGARGRVGGVALARRAFARVLEGFVNQDRSMQYRWERWFAPLLGGFEEFSVVLSTAKEPPF